MKQLLLILFIILSFNTFADFSCDYEDVTDYQFKCEGNGYHLQFSIPTASDHPLYGSITKNGKCIIKRTYEKSYDTQSLILLYEKTNYSLEMKRPNWWFEDWNFPKNTTEKAELKLNGAKVAAVVCKF